MNKTASIIVIIVLVLGIGIVVLGSSKFKSNSSSVSVPNTEIKDGVQYVTIKARGGYSPRVSSAQAGIPTKLVVKTSGSYDCSSSLVIHSIGFKKILAQTGEEIIDLGVPKAGQSIEGLCSMGMYSFVINFS